MKRSKSKSSGVQLEDDVLAKFEAIKYDVCLFWAHIFLLQILQRLQLILSQLGERKKVKVFP